MKKIKFSGWFILFSLCLLLLGCDSGSQDTTAVEEAGAVIEEETEKTIAEPTMEPIIESVAEATEEPTLKPTPKPTPKKTMEPVLESTPIPIMELTPEPTAEPTPMPVQESVEPAAGESAAVVVAPAETKETEVAAPESNETNPTVSATGAYAVNAKNGKIHIVGKCPATAGENRLSSEGTLNDYDITS